MTAPRRRSFVAGSVYLFERLLPDPFVIAIGLTFAVAAAALLFAPKGDPVTVVTSWYAGLFGIVGFAFQMVMILVTGHALAHAPIVQRALKSLVGLASTANQAVILTFLVAAAASWLNWGFGLVVGAILAREVAKRIHLDFGWLVAAAYSGWVIWASGPSSSIALSQATHANALNIVEKLTGHLLPFGETVFTTFNLVPTALVVILMPLVFILLKPREDEIVAFVPAAEERAAASPAAAKPAGTFADKANRATIVSLFLALLGLSYLAITWASKGVNVDVNAVILILLVCGVCLHGTPVAYSEAMKNAARQAGSMILQYPIYGGIMGIMGATGLAAMISKFFVAIATGHTLPFWTYFASLFITFLVPSGGGHWAVQGPFAIPAAVTLHASIPAVTMSVALGEQVSNMMQPFWALPVVAMAGIGIQRVLGFTVVTFLVAGIIYGAALLILT
ncbi:MAG: short-chain fatty acid transporter [Rhodospirillales bacterium]|nr:short-chain fatty acid transporter [Rhodospirillales bacterium]MDE2576417.1 short-chain fatty acid transporter [Rhodospirillales bacterium]